MVGRFCDVKQGDLSGYQAVFMVQMGPKSRPTEVRAPIVAWKPGNAGGAKGCRKVETR
jgi:hypothetical protein